MDNITFKLSDLHIFGSAFFDFLALRKHFFVDLLHWDVPHDDKFEMDQYDNPQAFYSLVLDRGRVVGGARAMPTTAKWGAHSYMLRDAVKGQLEDIPADVMLSEIVQPDIWECTRLVMSETLTTHAERNECLSLIVGGLADVAAENGASSLISLSPLPLMRALRQLGYAADRLGEPYESPEDGRRYAVLTMPVERRQVRVPMATHNTQRAPLHAPQIE